MRAILEDWPGVYYDDQKRVIGFWGLAIPEMPHRLVVDGKVLHTWCAWDSLFIPGILGKAARVESTDPETGESVRLSVSADGLQDVSPRHTVVSFLAPQTRFDANVRQNFCHFVHFFASENSARRWTGHHPGTFILSIDAAYKLGKIVNARHYRDVLR
jgi:alkylmercury lyase